MGRTVSAVVALLVLAVGACSRSERGASAGYCDVVVATHEEAQAASRQNASSTALQSINATRSAVAPSELQTAWMALQAGPGMESDGNGVTQKNRDFDSAIRTIAEYNQSKCGVSLDLAVIESVVIRPDQSLSSP